MSEESATGPRTRVIVGALVLSAAVLLPLGVAAASAHPITHTYQSASPACGGGGATGDD
ncbi:MAG TPA: hypothetical protein VGN81_39895 [Pseudonocardiaceae bacterium]